jgi:hypothetical protein
MNVERMSLNNLKYVPVFAQGDGKKTTEALDQNIWLPSSDFNSGLPEYGAGALINWSQICVHQD